ncbi:MAG: TFIIB-type zinc finger domain-containing protein [Litoreibacter sp.]
MGTTSTDPTFQEYLFPCDTCGSDLRFDPDQGQMLCDHCGNSEPLLEHRRGVEIRELDFAQAAANQLDAEEIEETRTSTCTNCAAEVSFDPSSHAMECPFCATPIVTDTGVHRHIKPKGLLPFVLEERVAHDAMNNWLGRLWFAPSGLQDYARKGRKMTGIYVPFWTYDAATRTHYHGQKGIVYYETRHVRDSEGNMRARQVAKTRWHSVKGSVSRQFDDILVLGSRSLPEKHTRALAPWDLSELTPYSPEYLAGFRAEGYTIDLENGYDDARQQMDRRIERDIRFDIGGDKQRIQGSQTDVRNLTFKHILLPIWVAAYKYRGKSYRFVVNGQTGAVEGERPYSTIKIALAVIALLLVIAAAAYGGYIYDDTVLR